MQINFEKTWVRFLGGDKRTPQIKIAEKRPKGFFRLSRNYAAQNIRYFIYLIGKEMEA